MSNFFSQIERLLGTPVVTITFYQRTVNRGVPPKPVNVILPNLNDIRALMFAPTRRSRRDPSQKFNAASDAIHEVRETAMRVTQNTVNSMPQSFELLEKSVVLIKHYYPTRHRRDTHNLLIKPILDGITDSKLVWRDDDKVYPFFFPIIKDVIPRISLEIYRLPD